MNEHIACQLDLLFMGQLNEVFLKVFTLNPTKIGQADRPAGAHLNP